MVSRTLQSYMLLSVTIVLSFSLLLGYLLYTDPASYNKYKDIEPNKKNGRFLTRREQEIPHLL